MFKIKEVEEKVTPSKISIAISDIHVDGDMLVDEEGNIAQRLKEAIGDVAETFTIKVSIELPTEE